MRKPLHPIPYGLAVPRPTSRHPPVHREHPHQFVVVGCETLMNIAKAALFQLASDMPAPVLAELLRDHHQERSRLGQTRRPRLDRLRHRTRRSMPHRRRS